MPRHKPLEDDVKAAHEFAGIINARTSKDFGHKGLVIGTNVEITDAKKVTRRMGYSLVASGAYTAIYGTDAQDRQYAVKGGNLIDIARTGVETVLAGGILGTNFVWDEDPNNNVYFTSDLGSSGIITSLGQYLPLSLPVPVIQSVGVVDPGTWQVTPFRLGKKYSDSARVRMQVLATYVMPDGRESAPSETIELAIAPEVRMIRTVIPTGGAGVTTRIYATAPGGSTYYLVGTTTIATMTLLVQNMNWTATGVEFQGALSQMSFPTDAKLLCFLQGKLLAAVYDARSDMGAVYISDPLQYHVFNPDRDGGFIGLSSCPLLLLPYHAAVGDRHGEATEMIIGTSTNIYHYDGQFLTEVANYGVVPGVCGDVSKEGIPYFWTVRGVAKAMPFELVTKHTFYGDPGTFNVAKIIYDRGYAKLVASTQSGSPTFNQWTER